MKQIVLSLLLSVSAFCECACDKIKEELQLKYWSKHEVAEIVDHHILNDPENLRIIVQCAIAVAPDALEEILAVEKKYLRVTGGQSAKGKSKDIVEISTLMEFFERIHLDIPRYENVNVVINPKPVTQVVK
jgi:hypothetical protein